MVELALVLPILLMLLVGIVEFGRAYNSQLGIQSAAREGARALALDEAPGTVRSAVNQAAGGATVTGISLSGCPANSDATSTAYASVTVTANITFGIPFVPLGTKTLTATARMRRCRRWRTP